MSKAAKTFSQPLSQGEVNQPLAGEVNPARRRCVSQKDIHVQLSVKPQVASLESLEKTASGCSIIRIIIIIPLYIYYIYYIYYIICS